MTNRDKLKHIIDLKRLSYRDVADVFNHKTTATVRSWLLPTDNKAFRNMPDEKLEVLFIRLRSINDETK